MFSSEFVGTISGTNLKSIEVELKGLTAVQNLTLLTKGLASQEMPREVAEEIQSENHNDGTQVLQGIFQKFD